MLSVAFTARLVIRGGEERKPSMLVAHSAIRRFGNISMFEVYLTNFQVSAICINVLLACNTAGKGFLIAFNDRETKFFF